MIYVNDLLTEGERGWLWEHRPSLFIPPAPHNPYWICSNYCGCWPCGTATLLLALIEARQETAEATSNLHQAGVVCANALIEVALIRARADAAEVALVTERSRHAELEREMLERGTLVFAEMKADRDRLRAFVTTLAEAQCTNPDGMCPDKYGSCPQCSARQALAAAKGE